MTAPRYLLDTNIVSYLVKQAPAPVGHRFDAVPRSSIAISVVSEAELLYGLARNPATKARAHVHDFLAKTVILPWTSEAAAQYADLRATHERSGKSIHILDLLIAAHALALGATLVTNDQVFRDIPGLICEDWTRN